MSSLLPDESAVLSLPSNSRTLERSLLWSLRRALLTSSSAYLRSGLERRLRLTEEDDGEEGGRRFLFLGSGAVVFKNCTVGVTIIGSGLVLTSNAGTIPSETVRGLLRSRVRSRGKHIVRK